MNSEYKNLVFLLEDKKTKKIIYRHDVELVEFQKELLEDKGVSFFYAFKDAVLEIEDELPRKLKLETKNETTLLIRHSLNILYQKDLDISGISEKDVEENEVKMYFIFEKASKIVINEIIKEHKNIMLSNREGN